MAEPRKITGKDPRDESIPELVTDLMDQAADLVHEEIAMAKAELSEKISSAAKGAGLFSGAMMAGLMTLGSATALAMIALSLVVAPWLAALIVTAAWGVLAAIFAAAGRGTIRKATPPVPEKTVETIKEDARWIKHPTR